MLKLFFSKKRGVNTYHNVNSSGVGSILDNSIISWVLWSCIGCVVLSFVFLGFFQMYRTITTSKLFAIERINIYGARLFSKSSILSEINLQLGMNCLAVNISNIEKTLKKNPCVEKVSVKRKLPGVIDIFITEYEPIFWILKNGLMYYSDKLGQAIIPVDPENFISLPTVEVFDGGEPLLPLVKDVLQAFQKMSPIDIGKISSFRLSGSKGIEVIIDERNLILTLNGNEWQKSVQWLSNVLHDLVKRNELNKVSQIIASTEAVWVVK